jgi:hypothetical protein
LLIWHVPKVDGLLIANLHVGNNWWHWIFADPLPAHDGYADNKDVLRIMMGRKPQASGNKRQRYSPGAAHTDPDNGSSGL